MAVNYKPLNRNQEWGTDAKRAIARLFGLAETAAAPSTSATISRSVVNRTLAGKVGADEEQAFRSLFEGLRNAMDADNASYDITPHVTNCAFSTSRRTKIIKNMANEVVAMISAS